jgi:UDP-N-acetylglucosamine 1-carboxyvinyltransferase
VIRNAAIEPEIYDLVKMLAEMGAQITIEEDVLIWEEITQFGITEKIKKWNVIRVCGCKSLEGVTHQVMPDRIEFGTYAIAAAITNGRCYVKETPLSCSSKRIS